MGPPCACKHAGCTAASAAGAAHLARERCGGVQPEAPRVRHHLLHSQLQRPHLLLDAAAARRRGSGLRAGARRGQQAVQRPRSQCSSPCSRLAAPAEGGLDGWCCVRLAGVQGALQPVHGGQLALDLSLDREEGVGLGQLGVLLRGHRVRWSARWWTPRQGAHAGRRPCSHDERASAFVSSCDAPASASALRTRTSLPIGTLSSERPSRAGLDRAHLDGRSAQRNVAARPAGRRLVPRRAAWRAGSRELARRASRSEQRARRSRRAAASQEAAAGCWCVDVDCAPAGVWATRGCAPALCPCPACWQPPAAPVKAGRAEHSCSTSPSHANRGAPTAPPTPPAAPASCSARRRRRRRRRRR